MAARSIASLSLSFGLVSIPVKLYSATESSASVRFNMLDKDGSRLKQQYVSEKDQHVVERAEMVKGYEFEKDRFVIFQPEELKALQESPSHTIDIVAFIPDKAIDPIFYDKAYFLAPDKRGGKPYNLLMEAMRQSGRCALAKWAWKAKQYVVQVRPAEDGLVLQQLLYADEVRSMKELDIEKVTVSPAELKLAMQLIDQISRGHLRPDDVRGRGEEAHPGGDRREDRRQADRRQRAARAGVRRRPGDRPDGGAARQPRQGRRPEGEGGAGERGCGQGRRAGGGRSGAAIEGTQGRQARGQASKRRPRPRARGRRK